MHIHYRFDLMIISLVDNNTVAEDILKYVKYCTYLVLLEVLKLSLDANAFEVYSAMKKGRGRIASYKFMSKSVLS
jgi:hypothetical protein